MCFFSCNFITVIALFVSFYNGNISTEKCEVKDVGVQMEVSCPPNCCCFSARYILQSRVWNVNSCYRNIWSLNVRIDTQILIMSSILVELTGDVFLKEKGDLRWWAVLAWGQWERWASFQAVYPSRLRWVARGLCWRQSKHSKKTIVKLAPTELFSTLFQG